MTDQNDVNDVQVTDAQTQQADVPPHKSRRWPWIAGIVAAFIVGLSIGAAGAGGADPELADATSVADLERGMESVQEQSRSLRALQQELATQQQEISQSEIDLYALQSELEDVEAELTDREAALDERESTVTIAEEAEAANTFGNGVFVVGEDIEPGEYRTAGANGRNPVGCYYAFLSDTGSDADIISNNITEGQTRATLRDGDVFESQYCEPWERVD